MIDTTQKTISGTIQTENITGQETSTPTPETNTTPTTYKAWAVIDKGTACAWTDGEYRNQLKISWPGNYKINDIQQTNQLWFIKTWNALYYIVNISDNEYDETQEIHLYKYDCVAGKSIKLDKDDLRGTVYDYGILLWWNDKQLLFQIYIADSYGARRDLSFSYTNKKITNLEIAKLAWYNVVQQRYSGRNDFYCHFETIKSITCMVRKEEDSDDMIYQNFNFNVDTMQIRN